MTAETAQQTEKPSRRDWRLELRDTIAAIPHKAIFGVLLLAWCLLFHFAGNSTQGYVKTPSLFAWLAYMYDMGTENQHGYLIPYAVLGFLWWKRKEFVNADVRFWWPGLGVLVLALMIHAFGFFIQQSQLSVVGFYIGIWGVVGMVWGPAAMSRTFFPFLLFVFCVPVASATDQLTFRLRWLATSITVKICHLLSIGVEQNGTNILDPQQRYQYDVAAACSGIRSLTAICAITLGYAFVFFTRWWKRAIVLILAIPLAVISNVLRLLTIVFASEIAGAMGRSPQAAGQYVHDSAVISLLPYVVAFAGVLLVARRLREDRDVDILEVAIPVGLGVGVCALFGWFVHRNIEVDHATYATGGPGLPAIALPFLLVIAAMLLTTRNPLTRLSLRGIAVSVAGLLIVGVSAFLLIQRQLWQRVSPPGVKIVPEPIYAFTETNKVLAGTNSVYLPKRVLSYDSQDLPLARIVWEWLPKDTTYGQRRYFTPGFFPIDNMVVLMGADRTSIHKPQYCVTGQGFTIWSETTDYIRMDRPVAYDLPVRKLKFKGNILLDGRRRDVGGVFVYWFVCDSELTAEHNKRMMQTTYELVRTGVMQRWAYVICMSFCEPGREDAAYDRVKEFIRAAVPEYQITVGKPLREFSSAGGPK